MVSKGLPVTSPPAITSAAASLTAASEVSIESCGLSFLVAILFCFVEDDRDQAFGFYFGGIGERQNGFHVCVWFQYRRREGNCARGRGCFGYRHRRHPEGPWSRRLDLARIGTWADPDAVHRIDVGASYGMLALVAAYVGGLPRLQGLMVLGLAVVLLAGVSSIGPDMTTYGHALSLVIGVLWWPVLYGRFP